MICFFFFNDPATTEIYTLSLHDALPIYHRAAGEVEERLLERAQRVDVEVVRRLVEEQDVAAALEQLGQVDAVALAARQDRKSTRLNSSHANISYAVFCLKKKKNTTCSAP